MLKKENKFSLIPEEPTIDDLVNFLIQFSNGAYTAEDFERFINSSNSIMERNTLLYNIGFQLAKNEEDELFMRDYFMQFEMTQIQSYLKEIDDQ